MDFLGDFFQIILFTIWISIFISFIMLVVRIIMDLFRDHDLSTGMRIIWLIFVLVLPVLGALVYLIARGGGMAERDLKDAKAVQAVQQEYVRNLAGGGGPATELKTAKELLDAGAIDQAEFDRLKAKALS